MAFQLLLIVSTIDFASIGAAAPIGGFPIENRESKIENHFSSISFTVRPAGIIGSTCSV